MEDVIWFWGLMTKILMRSVLWGFSIGILALIAMTEKPIYLIIPHPEAVVQVGFFLALILLWLMDFVIICIPFMFVYLIHIIWSLSKYMNICSKTDEEFIAEYPQYRKPNKRHDDFILVRKNSTLAQQIQLNDTKPG